MEKIRGRRICKKAIFCYFYCPNTTIHTMLIYGRRKFAHFALERVKKLEFLDFNVPKVRDRKTVALTHPPPRGGSVTLWSRLYAKITSSKSSLSFKVNHPKHVLTRP